MTKLITQGLGGVTIAVIAAAAALLLLASTAMAAGTVTGSTATVAAGAAAEVTITGNAGTGHGIGSYTVDVALASTVTLDGTTACTSHAAGDCNKIDATHVRFAGSTGSATGLTGDVVLGSVKLSSNTLTAGTCADITITVSEFNDETGAALGPSATNGKVCVAAATASPAPTTAAVLPSTGGPIDSNPTNASSMLTWLLVAAGLVVVSGGAWAVSRARREI
jgi:hypothetical protein